MTYKCNTTCRDCGAVEFTKWTSGGNCRCTHCGGMLDKGGKQKLKRQSEFKKRPATPQIQKSFSYQAYMRSARWGRKRRLAIGKAGGRCAECGSRDNLQVHHLTYARFGREKQRDLKVLCGTCHQIAHDLPCYLDKEVAAIVK